MNEIKDLATLVRAGTALIALETDEEARVVDTFRHAIGEVWRPLYRWSITAGLERLDIDLDAPLGVPPDSTTTLQAIKDNRERSIYLLLDFHPYLRYGMALRLMREILQRDGSADHTIVLVAPKLELPDELANVAVRFSLHLPDEAALLKLVREEAFAYSREHQGRRVEMDASVLKTLVRNLVGLTFPDARRIARTVIFDDGALRADDVPKLGKAKFELLNRDGLLHYEYDTASFADVAGLVRLKQWVAQRRVVFTADKPPPGLDPPKGLLLLGVQGCGKSLAAKAVAGGFGVPLVRLDFGTLYNKFHGETERNLRASLASADALAPCVLWIDEIEKGLAVGNSDDGVSRRVLGYLLTWMTERKSRVFLVATANQVRELPAELLRKGRFDEIFFVDLPDETARCEVFAVHLRKRGLDPASFDTAKLASTCDGYSGAEIEQAIVAALYAAHAQGRTVDTALIETELRNTRPLAVLMAEQVETLRAWARERTVPAG